MSTARKRSTIAEFRKATKVKPPENVMRIMREQAQVRGAIVKVLASGPKTIPEIAQATGMPVPKVAWYVLTFVKYKTLEPVEQTDEGYWRYKAASGRR